MSEPRRVMAAFEDVEARIAKFNDDLRIINDALYEPYEEYYSKYKKKDEEARRKLIREIRNDETYQKYLNCLGLKLFAGLHSLAQNAYWLKDYGLQLLSYKESGERGQGTTGQVPPPPEDPPMGGD